MNKNSYYSVLLDTSFVIRLLSLNDPLHNNAKEYFKYFLTNDIPMHFSVISIAEFCIKGEIADLPLNNLQIEGFNIKEAETAGRFARILYSERLKNNIEVADRLIIPNDVKLFSQAHCKENILYFVTSDVKSKSLIDKIKQQTEVSFKHLDITIPVHEQFGVLFV